MYFGPKQLQPWALVVHVTEKYSKSCETQLTLYSADTYWEKKAPG